MTEDRKNTTTVLTQEEDKCQEFIKVFSLLEDLKKEGKKLDIQICPKCGSPRVIRVGTMSGDLWGNMGVYPPKYICLNCGWNKRLVIFATNRLDGVKEVELIAEAVALSEENLADER